MIMFLENRYKYFLISQKINHDLCVTKLYNYRLSIKIYM